MKNIVAPLLLPVYFIDQILPAKIGSEVNTCKAEARINAKTLKFYSQLLCDAPHTALYISEHPLKFTLPTVTAKYPLAY